jgi:hypothetical protein
MNSKPAVNPVSGCMLVSRTMTCAGMMDAHKNSTKPTSVVDSVKVSLANAPF